MRDEAHVTIIALWETRDPAAGCWIPSTSGRRVCYAPHVKLPAIFCSLRFLAISAGMMYAAGVLAQAPSAAGQNPKAVEVPSLHNVFRIDDNLISGSSPDDEAGYAALAKLGVKVLISVDGSKPNVDLAHKYGMRYVHLPFGYDGVPKERIAELTKAVQTSEGTVYVHCHHGKHRGPAAVAGICRTLKNWDAARARGWLQHAGTGDEYAGLYRDVEKLGGFIEAELARVPATFPEIAKTPAEVDIMVAIDETFDRLKAAKAAGWARIPSQPDVTPVQAAAVLWEQFREHGRTGESPKHSGDYAKLLQDAESAALSLKEALRDPGQTAAIRDAAMSGVSQSCTACHKKHRN